MQRLQPCHPGTPGRFPPPVWRGLELQGSSARLESGGGQIDGVAMFAAIHLSIRAELPLDVFSKTVPALQVSRAELSFIIFFVARTLVRQARFYFGCAACSRRVGHFDPPNLPRNSREA